MGPGSDAGDPPRAESNRNPGTDQDWGQEARLTREKEEESAGYEEAGGEQPHRGAARPSLASKADHT
jgi:hypothetical protein